jgi:hypothetical protein
MLRDAVEAAGGVLQKAWGAVPRVGDGHAMGMVRLGFKELAHGMLPAFPPGQQIIDQPGLFGNPTQGEVAKDRQQEGLRLDGNEEPVRSGPNANMFVSDEMAEALGERSREPAQPRQERAQERTRERGGREM